MSNEYKDWLNDLTDEQRQNYELCMKYPILVPHNDWTGEVFDDYMYEYTELDAIPIGWKIAFGEQWAAEIQEAINHIPEEERGRIYILQLKEKFGRFMQYLSSYTDELDRVIVKYEKLSEHTCIQCGKPATKMSRGWVSPYCDECAAKLRHESFVDIGSE